MTPRIEFTRLFPDALRPEVEAQIPDLAKLIPPWCQRVTIGYRGSGDGDTNATVSTNFEYRNAFVCIRGEWVDDAPHVRRKALRHEFAHVLLCPLSDWMRDTLKRLIPEGESPKLSATLQEELRHRVEGVTQDLRAVVERLVPGPPPPRKQARK